MALITLHRDVNRFPSPPLLSAGNNFITLYVVTALISGAFGSGILFAGVCIVTLIGTNRSEEILAVYITNN